jgi:short-subunit dehydrogenase
VLIARRLDRLEALASELAAKHGIEATPLAVDLARLEARDQIAVELSRQRRDAEVLVNDAGFSIPDTFASTLWQRESDMIMTLVYAVAGLAHLVLPAIIAKGRGRIINVASVVGFSPGVAGHTLYPASKSFVIKLSQSLDCEVRAKGVKVTALCPGYTRTEFQKASGMDDLVANAPRWFVDEPEDVVRAALAANEAGRVIIVTGFHNKLSRLALKALPETLTRPMINYGARRYRRPSD